MNPIKKAWYRTFQCVFSAAQTAIPQRSPALLRGAGAVKELPAFILSKGIHKVLLVTGKTTPKLGLTDSLFEAAKRDGLAVVPFHGAVVDPPFDCIEEAVRAYTDNHCEGIIAFGGGSAMDAAKAAAARIARPHKTLGQLGGTLKVRKRIPPFFAVPTTAGTGSEATVAAVVKDPVTHRKFAIQDPSLLPKYAVLDPELTVALPPSTTAATGMDALTHAVEAYTNLFAPRYTRQLAEEAVALIFRYLKRAYADGKDLEAREQMLYASFLAGRAFSRACVGNVHAIAHTVGGLYGTPHGLANAVILPFVLEAYGSRVKAKLARLADLAGVDGSGCDEKARRFIEKIRSLNQEMGIEGPFDFIRDEDIPQMIRWAMKEANPLYPVPVIFDEPLMRQVIERVRTEGNAL